jgi:hypothetical protein
MPYILGEERYELQREDLAGLPVLLRGHPGRLAYCIYYLCRGMIANDYRYADLAQVVGVLDTIKAELQRQIINPYEDKKKNEYGGFGNES